MKTDDTLTVLIVEPLKKPYVTVIGRDLSSMQEVVGGLIEPVYLNEYATLVCNEEGKINGFQGNRRLGNDIIAGKFYICGTDRHGEFCSLKNAQIEHYMSRFEDIEIHADEEVQRSIFVEVSGVYGNNDHQDHDEMEEDYEN